MTFEIIKGDLFDSGKSCLAQGCNARGYMGAGIAKQFSQRWPKMFEDYKDFCNQVNETDNPKEILGHLHLWYDGDNLTIFNLFTQFYPGPDARYEAVRSSFREMFETMKWDNATEVAMPKIGCGIGGLEWEKVQNILEEELKDFPEIKVFVYEL